MVGCAAPEAPGVGNAAPKAIDVQATLPEEGVSSTLALWEEGKAVHVGDSEQHAFEVFPKPSKAVESSDLPSQIVGKYKARSWSGGSRGFGVITLEGRVVLALATYDNTTLEQVQRLVQEYTGAIPEVAPRTVGVEGSEYWFWELGTQRLMICESSDYKNRIGVALAVGDEKLMDALRMNPLFAAKDLSRANELLAQTKPGK